MGTEPDLSDVRRSDLVRLFLLVRDPVAFVAPGARRADRTAPPWWRRLRPRSWKGWALYIVAGLLVVGALAGDPEESREAVPAADEGVGRGASAASRRSGAAEREERAALRRQRIRAERARLRRERARRTRARRARAVARRKRERVEELAAAAPLGSASQAQANCHPSYDPCLDASASDYDCDGGSGDGPKYTGTVTVTGSDDYDLDSDDDGIGCDP